MGSLRGPQGHPEVGKPLAHHCEEQSDEEIHLSTERYPAMDCRVGLRPPRNDEQREFKSQFFALKLFPHFVIERHGQAVVHSCINPLLQFIDHHCGDRW